MGRSMISNCNNKHNYVFLRYMYHHTYCNVNCMIFCRFFLTSDELADALQSNPRLSYIIARAMDQNGELIN